MRPLLFLCAGCLAAQTPSFYRRDYPGGSDPISVAAGDFNGDGKPDLAITNFSSNGVVILVSSRDRSIAGGGELLAGQGRGSVVVADFNNDGRLDVAANGSVLLGNGAGAFFAARPFGGTGTMYAADFNGDGRVDILVSVPPTVVLFPGNGDGTFQRFQNVRTPVIQAFALIESPIAVADFNGDSKPDLAIADSIRTDTGIATRVSILLNNGDGSFTPLETPAASLDTAPAVLVAGDFNGDGKIDLVLADASTAPGSISFYAGNGNGGFSQAVTSSLGNRYGFGVATLVAADFNKDGALDLALNYICDPLCAQDEGPMAVHVSVLTGKGNGSFNAPVHFPTGGSTLDVTTGASIVAYRPGPGLAVLDINGDGKPDLVTANYDAGTITVLVNDTNPP